MILGCLDGEQAQKVAAKCQTRANAIIKWRDRFRSQGLAGLVDESHLGAPKTYGRGFSVACLGDP